MYVYSISKTYLTFEACAARGQEKYASGGCGGRSPPPRKKSGGFGRGRKLSRYRGSGRREPGNAERCQIEKVSNVKLMSSRCQMSN